MDSEAPTTSVGEVEWDLDMALLETVSEEATGS